MDSRRWEIFPNILEHAEEVSKLSSAAKGLIIIEWTPGNEKYMHEDLTSRADAILKGPWKVSRI